MGWVGSAFPPRTWLIRVTDNAWWGGIMGNAYFGSRFGDLTTTTAGVTTTALSATQQSVGTGLGTAGIMVGEFFAAAGAQELCSAQDL
jgi:hypothetical protein